MPSRRTGRRHRHQGPLLALPRHRPSRQRHRLFRQGPRRHLQRGHDAAHVGRATGGVVRTGEDMAAGIEPGRRRTGPAAQSRRSGIDPLRRQREESGKRTTGMGVPRRSLRRSRGLFTGSARESGPFHTGLIREPRIAVGTPVAGRPPHRSRRAVFPHRALQCHSLRTDAFLSEAWLIYWLDNCGRWNSESLK